MRRRVLERESEREKVHWNLRRGAGMRVRERRMENGRLRVREWKMVGGKSLERKP